MSEHSATALLAGVGVLLLAMGVGVLIGRSGNPPQAAQPAPQVITVSAPASSQQSPEPSTTTPSAGHAPKAAKHHSGSRVGSSVSKPAPSSVLEGLSHAKGKSYVEKSKNLPDVVSTG